MKLTINREALVKAVQDVSKAISTKVTIPILAGIKMEATDDGLILKGTDADMSIMTLIPLEMDEQTVVEIEVLGSIVLQAKLFGEIIKKLPNQDVSLEVTDNFVTTVKSGNAEYNIIGLDPDDYPRFPKVDKKKQVQFKSSDLKDVIQSTIFAASDSESRPALTGVLWNFGDGVLCTATDSYRLSNKKVMLDTKNVTDMSDVIVPKKSLYEISKLLNDSEEVVDVSFTDNQVLFKLKNTSIYSRLLEGNYPDTSRLIPTEYKTSIHINKSELLNSIARASLLATDSKKHVVKLQTQAAGTIQISSNTPELGKVEEELEAASIEGDELTVSFSDRYMREALKALPGEEIALYFNDSMRPFVMRPKDDSSTLQLILPVRTY